MKEKKLLLSEKYSMYNWLTPVIKTPNFNPTALKILLFLGYYHIGNRGGSFKNKLDLVRRTIKSRGFKYKRHPGRLFRTTRAFLALRKIVLSNLEGIDRKVRKQLRYGKLSQMEELKSAILQDAQITKDKILLPIEFEEKEQLKEIIIKSSSF